MRKLLFTVCITVVCFSFQANAQNFKFGHINGNEIMEILAEKDSLQSNLDKVQKDLSTILSEMAAELEKRTNEFSENQDKWSQVVKDSKQAEFMDLQKRAQVQQQNAQARYQQEYQKLLEPIQKKLKDAIDKVAKANGFTLIFDISMGNPVYFNETQSTDIGALVKKELGITK
jgi:outer membrane protein